MAGHRSQTSAAAQEGRRTPPGATGRRSPARLAADLVAWARANRERLLRIGYRLAVATVMVGFALVCLRGIANDWQWGHNGYNGAAFSQAARNSLRFDVMGQAQYYTGLAPPPPADMYTHHPLMLHFHLIALFELLGDAEWVARLVPAVYSFLGLVMLFVLARRYFGRATALAAIALHALIPLNLIFANMVDHEQGSIFWCLLFIYMYCRWTETARWSHFLLVMLGVSMAVQFDWPGYYIAFFLVVHAFLAGVRHQSRVLEWRREYTFAIVFSVVVLLNFYVFYRFIIDVRGGFNEMMGAYRMRSASPDGYWTLVWRRSRDLHGLLPLGLLAAWLVHFAIRAARRTLHLGDLVPLFFFLAQTVHSVLFKQAGSLHAYWTYHTSPAIALGGASVVLAVARGLPRVWREVVSTGARRFAAARRDRILAISRPVELLLGAAVVLVPLAVQLPFAARKLRWGFRTGAASYEPAYDDQYLQIEWAKELTRRFNRSNADFLIHSSVHWRIEWMWYLDAPNRPISGMQAPPGARDARRHQVMLFDLDHVHDRRALGSLIARHPAIVYARRFLVVDAATVGPAFEAYESVALPRSVWWRWLVNPTRPPLEWRPEPDPAEVLAMFASDVELTVENLYGGGGGGPAEADCAKGWALAGFDVSTIVRAGAKVLGAVQLRCRPLAAILAGRVVEPATLAVGPALDKTPEAAVRLECPPNQVAVGIYGRCGALVDSLGVSCAVPVMRPDGKGGTELSWSSATRVPTWSAGGGHSFESSCPPGFAAWGFRGRSGTLVDAVGIACARMTGEFLAASPAIDDPPQGSAPPPAAAVPGPLPPPRPLPVGAPLRMSPRLPKPSPQLQ
ncbi:MAG: glycosyltransferase family 39 protein [Deltaproteobacteria bacterium]|nr:glycosyltransferase family 39 protein [Deltaproteobacteria bacterium]